MSAFPRWLLALVAGLFGVVMILIAPSMDAKPFIYTFGAFCLLISVACVAPRRIGQFAGSLVGVVVFFLALIYLLASLGLGPFAGGQEDPSLIDAAMFLVVFGLPGLAFALRARFGFGRETPEAAERVAVDARTIRRHRSDGGVEEISWEQLAEVHIVTTDEGPWADDVFWLLSNEGHSHGVVISNSAEGLPALLESLQALPKFDNAEFAKAMGSTSKNQFLVWRRRG
jgi:hypothetical protein